MYDLLKNREFCLKVILTFCYFSVVFVYIRYKTTAVLKYWASLSDDLL